MRVATEKLLPGGAKLCSEQICFSTEVFTVISDQWCSDEIHIDKIPLFPTIRSSTDSKFHKDIEYDISCATVGCACIKSSTLYLHV